MKTILYILVFCLGLSASAFEDNRINHIQTDEYTLKSEHPCISLPVNFGKPFIIDDSDLEKLNTKEIYQIDLVYTRYKTSQTFDQQKLNQNRVNELKSLIPEIDKDAPAWHYIEQTKAIDRETAKNFFHGFVIHYRPQSINHSELKNIFTPYQTQRQVFTVNNSENKQITYTSGTIIHIPENAVSHADGSPVTGEYEVSYCEFRTPADIALSGIPMKYHGNDGSYNFSSIGMYEIRGFQDGKELTLNKPITVDFNCTKIVDDASFYQLNDQTNEWEVIQPIQTEDFGAKRDANQAAEVSSTNTNPATWQVQTSMPLTEWGRSENVFAGRGMRMKSNYVSTKRMEVKLNKKAWKSYSKIKDDKRISDIVLKEEEDKKRVYISSKNNSTFRNSVINGRFTDMTAVEAKYKKISQAYQNYSTMVNGLRTTRFGVYNCDQIYRLKNTKTIHPVYVDQQSGEEITEPVVACLMDLNYNASFSFSPYYITLNPNSKNAILLFTGESKTYLVLPHQLSTNQFNSNTPTIRMHDVTEQVKSSKDLQAMINQKS